MTLTKAEMDRRIAGRDAERERSAASARAARIAGPGVIPVARRGESPVAKPFCAVCAENIDRPLDAPPDWTPRREPLGRDGADVNVCEACATQRPVERTHLFGGGRGDIGEGNRWTSQFGNRGRGAGRRAK